MMFATLAFAALTNSVFTEPRLPVKDAVIQAVAPEANTGRDFILEVGPGKVLLIQDDSPSMLVPERSEVSEASLMIPVREGAPQVASVRVIRKPWREGEGWQGNSGQAGTGATWRSARSGSEVSRWATPGAGGDEDSLAIEGWKAEIQGKTLVISGLAESLNRTLRDPSRAYGYRIEFSTVGQIVSAEERTGGPRFDYKTKEAEGVRQISVREVVPTGEGRSALPGPWSAGIVNESRTDFKGLKAVWTVGDRIVSTQDFDLNGGEAKTLSAELTGRVNHQTPADSQVAFRIEGPGGSVGSVVHPWGVSVSLDSASVLRQAVDRLNRWILPYSRFSFAQEGVAERFRFAGPKEKPDIDFPLPAGLRPVDVEVRNLLAAAIGVDRIDRSGYGISLDTRDERLGIPGVPLPALGWGSRFADEGLDQASGLLGRFEAGALHLLHGVRGEARTAWRPTLPTSLVLRCFDLSGRPLNEVPLEVTSRQASGSEPLWKGKTLAQGGVFLNPAAFSPARPGLVLGREDALILTFSKGINRHQVTLSWADLVEEGLRGPAAAASIEIRIPSLDAEIDSEVNLAEGKTVEDSLGRFPAQLSGLIDGNPATAVEMPGAEGGWIEIDLGRDRPVAEIEFQHEDGLWRSFNIAYYGTSQSPASAQNWIQERESALRTSGGKTTYKGQLTLMRYIRILPLSGGRAKIKEVIIRTGTPVAPTAKPVTPPLQPK